MITETPLPALISKRTGDRVPFDPDKITQAIYRCMTGGLQWSSGTSGEAAYLTTQHVLSHLRLWMLENPGGEIDVESVQNQVERSLMELQFHDAARAYILYREERRRQRLGHEIDPNDPWLPVVREILDRTTFGLTCVDQESVLVDALRALFPGATRVEMFKALVLACRARIEQDPEYDQLTVRVFLLQIYEESFGIPFSLDTMAPYAGYFQRYLGKGVEIGRLDPRLLEFDLDALEQAIEPSRDLELKYFGLQTLYDRYFIHDEERRIELPQCFWMRVAMGLALAEKEDERTERAIEFYRLMVSRRYCPSTPTLFNAGTTHPQLSSCFLTSVQDDLDHIFQSIKNNALLSKWSGGLGNAWSKVRATNARIKGTNGRSQGTVPFLKVADSTAVAVNQGGKRLGAVAAYLAIWHLDFEEFLELRKNTGDDRRRTHDMHTAAWIPDLFMQRVEQDGEWTLFSPDEAPRLTETYGSEFRDCYLDYEILARAGELRQFKTMKAKDLWRRLLTMLFETGHPWITFQDPSNIRSPQDHAGVIHSSNLCTEILLNTSREECAVCNLGSVNLAAHIVVIGDLLWLDEIRLRETVRTAVRMLDNVIDINLYPIPEARNSNLCHRPIGLGLMGFQDALYQVEFPFAGMDSVEFSDYTMELLSYYAIDASCELAAERGSYGSFPGSKWCRGILPIDSIAPLEHERGEPIDQDRSFQSDWEQLRRKIRYQGMRNSNVLAIAPTATISNIFGVSTSIEPTFANLFVKSTMSGEFTVVNEALVRELKKRGLWDAEMLEDLKWFDGQVSEIDRIPEEVRALFQTAFEIEPRWVIEHASRRQKWIDQSQSVNLWLAEPSGKKLSDMYMLAWKKGLKTTYYLRTKAATQVEKSTVDVNRRGIQPRWMKSRSASAEISVERADYPGNEVKACKLDDPECEACQ
jgi:ribonucleoside-diphosphate reductase alpha chain